VPCRQQINENSTKTKKQKSKNQKVSSAESIVLSHFVKQTRKIMLWEHQMGFLEVPI
jgi:hypothetical protein